MPDLVNNARDASPPKRAERRVGSSRRRAIASAVFGFLRFTLVIALLAGGAFAAYWFNATDGTSKRSAARGEEASRLVEVVVAERGDHPVRIRAMGTVVPAREAVLRPRVSGMILEEAEGFVPGGYFEQGAFMVQLDRADYEQTLLQRETDLARAEAALQIELGDQAVAREELELLAVDIPEINRDLILRIPQVNRARAEVRAAEAAVQRARLDLDRTRLVAPYDGHIVSRRVSAGNNVTAGDELATFVGAGSYWVETTVPESNLRWIEAAPPSEGRGSPARVRNDRAWGAGVSRDGRVTQLVGRLEEGSRLARVIVTVSDPLALDASRAGTPPLILGALVDVEIDGTVLEDAFVIDRDLVREGDAVWVMGDDDRLVIRPVAIEYRGRDEAYVTEGLLDGDRMVRTNLTTPVEGMLLRAAASGAAGDETLVMAGPGTPTDG